MYVADGADYYSTSKSALAHYFVRKAGERVDPEGDRVVVCGAAARLRAVPNQCSRGRPQPSS